MTSTSDEVGHTLDLDAIEARANAATPGPWFHRQAGQHHPRDLKMPYDWIGDSAEQGKHKKVIITRAALYGGTPDYAFIANARTDIPALVAECRSLRNSHDSLVKALEPFANLGVGVGPDDEVDDAPYRILRGAIHNARAALSQAKGGK